MDTEDAMSFPVVNLAKYQMDTMSNYGDMVALIDANTGKQYTYAEVIDRTQKLAAGLQSLGLRQGDILCALTFNTIEYAIIWYAVNLLGGTFQTASPLYTDEELERRFKECNTKFLVTTPQLASRITAIKLRSFSFSKPNILNKVIVLGDTNEHVPYQSLFTDEKITEPAPVDPRTSPCILLSSSGTTGLPKFVKLSHVNIVSNIIQHKTSLEEKPGVCSVLALPTFHHFGVHTGLGTLLTIGMKVVLMERFDTEKFLLLIDRYKAEFLQIVPTMAARVIKFKERSKYDISSVRFVQTGAAPLGVGIEKQLKDVFSLKFIGQAYGLTETGFNSGNTKKKHKFGSSGVVGPGVSVKSTDSPLLGLFIWKHQSNKNQEMPRTSHKAWETIPIEIVDPDTGSVLPTNKRGEILVGGPQITIGYLNHPEADKVSFDENGYFKTGDIGYFDDEGFLFIVDRLKELIKYQGMQVAPAYLEDLLIKHPAIADAAVIGVPDTDAGELPKAFVVKQQGKQITEDEVVRYVADHVSPHMRLRGGVEFISQVPRNPSGKILRRFLRDKGDKSKL